MTVLLIALILFLSVLLLRSRNADRAAEHMALRVIAPMTLILAMTQLFAPQKDRTLRDALKQGSVLRNAEVIRLAEFIASRPESGTVVFLHGSDTHLRRDPVFNTLRKTLPASLPLEGHPLGITLNQDAISGEDESAVFLPRLDWPRVNWVIVSQRHPAVLRQLRSHPDAGGVRRAVLFAEDETEARSWVDSGLADAAVYYGVAPELHARLRSGSALTATEVRGLFHILSP